MPGKYRDGSLETKKAGRKKEGKDKGKETGRVRDAGEESLAATEVSGREYKTFYRFNLNFTIRRLHHTAIVSHLAGRRSAFYCSRSMKQLLFFSFSVYSRTLKMELNIGKERISASIVLRSLVLCVIPPD